MRQILSGIALAMLLAFSLGASLSSRPEPPAESSTPPEDKSLPWMDPATRWIYMFSTSLNLWVGPSIPLWFGLGGVNQSGALKVAAGNMVSDSTAATEKGYDLDMAGIITRVTIMDAVGSGTVLGSAMLLASGQDTLYLNVWPTDAAGNSHDSTGLALSIDATDIISAYGISGAVDPDFPKMVAYFSPTVAP